MTTRADVKLPLQKNLSDSFSGNSVDEPGETWKVWSKVELFHWALCCISP